MYTRLQQQKGAGNPSYSMLTHKNDVLLFWSWDWSNEQYIRMESHHEYLTGILSLNVLPITHNNSTHECSCGQELTYCLRDISASVHTWFESSHVLA